jgi:hypothetical protein
VPDEDSNPFTEISQPVSLPPKRPTTRRGGRTPARRRSELPPLPHSSVAASDTQGISFSFNEVLFKFVEGGKITSVLTGLPFERAPVENLAKKYWPKMHLFSSTGRGISPKKCYDILVQDGAQTIFLIKKGDRVDVNEELINAGIERVVEIEPDNQEYVQSNSIQTGKRKRGMPEDPENLQFNDRG